jgi:hypothetical protein
MQPTNHFPQYLIVILITHISQLALFPPKRVIQFSQLWIVEVWEEGVSQDPDYLHIDNRNDKYKTEMTNTKSGPRVGIGLCI